MYKNLFIFGFLLPILFAGLTFGQQGAPPLVPFQGDLHVCGDEVVGTPLAPNQANTQDRWNQPFPRQNGNSRRGNQPAGSNKTSTRPGMTRTPLPLAPTDCANGFILTFEDVESGTGVGFDDPTLSPCGGGLTLGEERISTVCAVFDYISSVIDMGAVNTSIYFESSEMDGTGALASASPLFDVGVSPGTNMGGYLRDHIVNGVDPNPTLPDAIIKFDFGTRFIDGEPLDIFPCTSCPDGALDLYTIMLHEATHALGFFSLINPLGNSMYSGLVTGPFSLYDENILNTASGNIINFSGTFVGPVIDLTSDGLTYFETGNTQEEPVFSPGGWDPGSSMSHFDHNRSVYNYVMRPSTSGGDDRLYTMSEIEVLIDLGYTMKAAVYTGTPAPNRYVIGTDDVGYVTTPGTMICVPALSNDTDPDGDAISYGNCGSGCTETPSDLTLLLGEGLAEIVGSDVCFTPEEWYAGPVVIKYCPTDGKYNTALVNTDNCTFIFIDVEGPCPGDPCNMVCNGNFENRVDNCVTSIGFSTLNACPNPNMANLCRTKGSPDIHARGCPGMSTPADWFDIPNSFHAGLAPLPGTDTWNAPDPDNNTFLAMLESTWGTNYTEGFSMQLTEPLTPGETYQVGFWASAKTKYNPSGGVAPADLVVGFTTTAPPSGGDATFNTPLDWYAPSNSPFFSDVVLNTTLKDDAGVWDYYTFDVTPTTAGLEYIVFESSLIVSGTFRNVIFIDDVSVKSPEPEILIKKIVDNPFPLPGETITYTIIISNMDPTEDATDLEIYDLLPAGVTYVSSTLSLPPSDHFIATLPAISSMSVTIEATVDLDAPIGVPITNCAYLTSGNSCLNTGEDNCADIVIKGTDIEVVKTLTSGPGPYSPGDLVTFDIVVENLGPFDANAVWVQEILPPEMTYISHTIAGPGSYVHPDFGIPLLPNGDQSTLSLTVQLNSLATCGTYTNCVNLISIAEEELVISNNSSCADVEVDFGALAVGFPVHPVGTHIEQAHGVENTDTSFYITGFHTQQIDFGYGPMISTGGKDAYVIKYGTCGIEWQHGEGSFQDEEGIAIMLHPITGRLYACGNFESSFNYQGVNLTGSGGYVVELNPATGMALWGKTIPGLRVEDLTVDEGTGRVAVTGALTGSTVFNATTYTSVGGTDMFVAVYDANGVELFADAYGSTADDAGKGVSFHPTGRLYMSGFLGSVPTGPFNATAPMWWGGTDGFVGRYAPTGSRMTGHYFLSQGDDSVNDIEVDFGSGQVYVVGNNGGYMVIPGGLFINSYGGQDAFAARLSGGMNGIWVKDFGGISPNDYGEAVALSGGRLFMSGGFQGTANFPGFPSPTLNSMSASDIFMATMSKNTGNPVNNIQSSPIGNDQTHCYDIVADAAGNGYIPGDFYQTTLLGVSMLTSLDGQMDAFVVRGDGNAGGIFYKAVTEEIAELAGSDPTRLSIYPNPTTGQLTIEQEIPSDTPVKISLTDTHGRTQILAEKGTFSGGKLNLDVSGRAAGLYFLTLEYAGKRQMEKVMLMHP